MLGKRPNNWRKRKPIRGDRRLLRRTAFEALEQRVVFDSQGWMLSEPMPVVAEGESTDVTASISVPEGPVRSLEVVFTRPMALNAMIADGSIRSAISIVDIQGGELDLTDTSFVYTAASRKLTWTSPDVLTPGIYEIRIDGSAIADTNGNLLHGGEGGLSFSIPVYDEAQAVHAGGGLLDVESYSAPAIVDWNSDGLRDLITGEKTASGAGKVRVYLNTGTAEQPAFASYFYVQQSGQDLAVAGSGCLGAFPRVFDWDRDGKKDLLVGLADGRLQLFLNTNTHADPAFAVSSFVQAGPIGATVDLDVGARAAFDIVDWNNDGREDLVIGGLDGKVRVYIDMAFFGSPNLAAPLLIQNGSGDLVVSSSRSSVDVVDLNGDGRKDLLLGNTDGQLNFYPNVGTDPEPVFAGFEMIGVNGSAIDLPGTPRSRPFVGSLQADDIPELWVGEESGLIHRYAVASWPDPVLVPIQDAAAGTTLVYRFESLLSEWQNPFDPYDVNDDGYVAPGDVLLIINEINNPTYRDAVGKLPLARPVESDYYDSNGDGYCAPGDVLLIINWINDTWGESDGEGESTQWIASSEPSETQAQLGRVASVAEIPLLTIPAERRLASAATPSAQGTDGLAKRQIETWWNDDLESTLTLLAEDR